MQKVLVANRGEIARRVFRTVRALGLRSVAVFSDADADAPHVRDADEAVRIGPAPARESYLAIERVIEAARRTGADAIHPGYGFLSENAEFAEACAAAGITFIGPPPEAIRRMGSKIEGKRTMEAAGVPVVPGFAAAGLDDAAIVARAGSVGFPLLVKASAGGGGKGMRIVRDAAALPDALAGARREAAASFGDDTLLLERYVEAPRHVEIQIFADQHGHVLHCFERECSIQRRHQKVIEEAPSPAVTPALRAAMGAAAVAGARAIGYVGAGTFEFILDASGAFYFLEVNTRLQVEHPVTEMVTGLDLVALQVAVARGEPLPFTQDDLTLSGHAIEARLYAEDPANDFLPAPARVLLWDAPNLPGVRWDAGVVSGTAVGIDYDPMLAKVIAHGATRGEAARRLADALARLGVAGPMTNRAFLVDVLRHPAFLTGATDTHFIERHFPPAARAVVADEALERHGAIVAALYDHAARARAATGPLPASIPSGWRNNRWRPERVVYRAGEREIAIEYVARPNGTFDVGGSTAIVTEADDDGLTLELDGVRRRHRVVRVGATVVVHGVPGTVTLTDVPRFPPPRADLIAGGCVAPMTGIVRQVRVAPGDAVTKGQVLLVLEAMKMEHEMAAAADGTVAEVRVEVGQMVDPDQVLVVVE